MSVMNPRQIEHERQNGYLPARVVCDALYIQHATLYNRIQTGLYEARQVGKFWYVKVDSIQGAEKESLKALTGLLRKKAENWPFIQEQQAAMHKRLAKAGKAAGKASRARRIEREAEAKEAP